MSCHHTQQFGRSASPEDSEDGLTVLQLGASYHPQQLVSSAALYEDHMVKPSVDALADLSPEYEDVFAGLELPLDDWPRISWSCLHCGFSHILGDKCWATPVECDLPNFTYTGYVDKDQFRRQNDPDLGDGNARDDHTLEDLDDLEDFEDDDPREALFAQPSGSPQPSPDAQHTSGAQDRDEASDEVDDHGDHDLDNGDPVDQDYVGSEADSDDSSDGTVVESIEEHEELSDEGTDDTSLDYGHEECLEIAYDPLWDSEPGSCRRHGCSKPNDDFMVHCDNKAVHGETEQQWWHYGCVPYANGLELPQGRFHCPRCVDAGHYPAEYVHIPWIPGRDKPRSDNVRTYTKAQCGDQSIFPNPLLHTKFYPKLIEGTGGWTVAEQKACIFQYQRLHPRWLGSVPAFHEAVSREMLRMQDADKSANAVKNWWNRKGRAMTGLDERGRVSSGNENTLATSQQGRKRAWSSDEEDSEAPTPKKATR